MNGVSIVANSGSMEDHLDLWKREGIGVEFGKIKSDVGMINGEGKPDCFGCGFVNFEKPKDASRSIDAFDKTQSESLTDKRQFPAKDDVVGDKDVLMDVQVGGKCEFGWKETFCVHIWIRWMWDPGGKLGPTLRTMLNSKGGSNVTLRIMDP